MFYSFDHVQRAEASEEELRNLFENNLRAHDWYYAESDDLDIYRQGQKERTMLEHLHVQLSCPFTLIQLRNWVFATNSVSSLGTDQQDPIMDWFARKVPAQQSFSIAQVEKILSNLGVDTSCGACMATAFTGSAPGLSHTCSKSES